MILSFVTVLIVPIILFASVFDVSDAFSGAKLFGNDKKGIVLGAHADFDEANQVFITEKNEKEALVDIVHNKKDTSSQVYNLNDIAKLPNSYDKYLWPKPVENFSEILIDSNIASAIDLETSKILYNKNNNTKVPIASITKLMTALVFIDHNPGWDTIYTINDGDRREGGRIYLYLGDQVSVRDLFNLSLVGSANTATIALVHSTGLSEVEFVQKMNEKAKELGLENTNFSDPTGLSNYNTSTAYEVAQIAKHALANVEINKATLKSHYTFRTLTGRTKKVYTTDYLLENFPENGIKLLGGKTGYTDLAGFCFVGKFIDKQGNEIITVILNSDNVNSRFTETRRLVEWVYGNYQWN